jgi:recombinational DNA repair protein (RecF pathway)
MYTLHTTEAFILDRYEHGESSYVYKLFTEQKGVLFAHAQGVREGKNRNRYALRTHARISVTLVRGKAVWRVTTAREMYVHSPLPFRNMLHAIGGLLPAEVPEPSIFLDIAALQQAMHVMPTQQHVLERIGALRGLHALGYINKKDVPCIDSAVWCPCVYTDAVCLAIVPHLAVCTQTINQAFARV